MEPTGVAVSIESSVVVLSNAPLATASSLSLNDLAVFELKTAAGLGVVHPVVDGRE